MVGDKIRKLRLALRLSQQQLAGKEITRGFISHLESGKCNPSPETLRLIAQRLGKPVEYFLHDAEDDGTVQAAIALLESAKRDLETGDPGHVGRAHGKLLQSLKYCTGMGRIDLEAQCRTLLIESLRKQGKYEEILDEGERALTCYKELGDREALAQTYQQLAVASYLLEDFAAARRAYEKATLYSAGLKTMSEFRVEALTVLGSCLFRLGEYAEARRRYQEAIEECSALGTSTRRAKLMMGLGWVLFKSGNLKEAWQWTRQAADSLKKAQSPDFMFAHHNLAIIEAARGNWEQSYAILQDCLKTYRAEGRLDKQASIYEELARYWLHKGNVVKAETICWEALELLDLKDDGGLRGRLYRMLGILAARRGNVLQGRNLLRISYSLFRRLRARAEASESLAELEKLRGQTVATEA